MGWLIDRYNAIQAMTPEEREERRLRMEKWREENKGSIQSMNDWVKKHGLPFDEYRKF